MPHAQNHTVDIIPERGRVRAYFADAVIADTEQALIVRETGLPDRLYLPREDVKADLAPSTRRSTCPYKGQARYWTLRTDGRIAADVAWSYFQPTPIAEPIRDYLSFYADRVTIHRES